MTDFIVVGGGLSGLLTARELRLAGASVKVIDRGPVGREASWAGGGILSPLYPWRYPAAVLALAHWSQGRYPDLCAELAAATGIDPEWTGSGMLILDGDEPAAWSWSAHWQARLERVGAERIAELQPGLARAGPALWLPDVAQVRNPRLLQALRADLVQRGVTLVEEQEVLDFRCEGGRISAVLAGSQTHQGGSIVVTAGAWSGRLLAGLGIQVQVHPVKGQMLLLKGAPGLLQRMVMEAGRYLIPRRDGRILVGSSVEEAGFDKVPTPEVGEALRRFALDLVPALAACSVERHWAGLRPGSPSGVPFIGPVPAYDNLFLNAGHFRNGVVMGLAGARLAADLCLHRSPNLDPTPYGFGAAR